MSTFGAHNNSGPAYSASWARTRGRGRASLRGGRGGRSDGGGRGYPKKYEEPPKPDLSRNPLGQLLSTLSNSDVQRESERFASSAAITDCNYVSSYNWVDSGAPTIIVPGRPPRWTPLREARRLLEDKGDYFRDPNGARFPSYPTEPAVQAVLRSGPTMPTSNIDIFACGSTIGNLLRFVRDIKKPFRFSVELIGNTVFFVRKENSPKELLSNVRGFGHTFPEAYTTWDNDMKGSGSHQRIVQYSFGGLRCLVRFECDGYLHSGTSSSPSAASLSSGEDLAQTLATASISQTVSEGQNVLNIRTGGTEVQQDRVFDLKTRSGKWAKMFDFADILPQLYIKQIPNFILAYHDGAGLFPDDNITVHNLKKELETWEEENKEALKQLAFLLDKIVQIARQDQRGLLEVYSESTDSLRIHSQLGEGSHALPPSLREEWQSFSNRDEDSYSTGTLDFSEATSGIKASDDIKAYLNDSSDEEKDFTACSIDTCGYCGRCSY